MATALGSVRRGHRVGKERTQSWPHKLSCKRSPRPMVEGTESIDWETSAGPVDISVRSRLERGPFTYQGGVNRTGADNAVTRIPRWTRSVTSAW